MMEIYFAKTDIPILHLDKVEKYRDSLCRKLVSLNGDEVDYKVIFGP
jgi:hypothetical protein